MYSIWTKHLKDEDDRLLFKNSVVGSKKVLERLKTILEEIEAEYDRSEMDINTYDVSPNWPFKQAHKNGARMAIHKIKSLINLETQ